MRWKNLYITVQSCVHVTVLWMVAYVVYPMIAAGLVEARSEAIYNKKILLMLHAIAVS